MKHLPPHTRARRPARRAARCLALAATLAIATPAFAAGGRIVISTGLEGGSYFHIGSRLKTELILRNEQPPPAVIPSEGSLDNLARLDNPKDLVNVALTQADALRTYLSTHPDFRGRFFVLGDVGRECALVVASKSGPIRTAADLKTKRGGALAVHAADSGAAVTWAAMQTLEPEFAKTQTVQVPVMEALLQLKEGGEFSNIRSVMIVQRPTRLSPAIRAVLDTPETYRFVPIRAADLPNATLPDGTEIYSFEKVSIGPSGEPSRPEVETICTRGLMLGSREKLDPQVRERLAAIMLEKAAEIAGTD